MQIFEYRTFECNIIIYLLSYFIERILFTLLQYYRQMRHSHFLTTMC